MTQPTDHSNASRRRFLKQSGTLAVGVPLLGAIPKYVHAGEDNTIRLALIGCGGRGSGAVGDALSVPDGGPVKLYVMADLLEKRIANSYNALKRRFGDKVDVSDDRKFVGFDAYRKAIDSLRPGDIAMCTTRAYIRPMHVEYAVSRGINVFMEKPFAPDPGGLHRLLRAGEEAEKNERQDRRRAAVPSLAGAPGADRARSATARWATSTLIRANRLGGVLARRSGRGGARSDESTPVRQDPSLLGRLGPHGRLSDPPDRRMLLDQGCLARCGTGVGRTRARQRRLRPEHRRLLDGIHVRRRHQGVLRLPSHQRHAERLCHLHSRHQMCRAVLRHDARRHRPHVQGPADRRGQHRLDAHQGRLQSVAVRMERLHRQHPQRSAPQRSQTRGLLGPDDAHGPRRLPHRPDRDLGRDDDSPSSSSATTSTISISTARCRSKRTRTASFRFRSRASGRRFDAVVRMS